MIAEQVEDVIILGGNPAYYTPADVPFADAISRMKQSLHVSSYFNETSARCAWHLPRAHLFESWGDARAFDGTTSFVQPVIAPLYGGKTDSEILAVLLGKSESSAHGLLQAYWKNRTEKKDFESWWQNALRDGFVSGSAFSAVNPAVAKIEITLGQSPNQGSAIEVIVRPDPTIRDGEFSRTA